MASRLALGYVVLQLPRGSALPVILGQRAVGVLGKRDTGSGNTASAKIIVPVVLVAVISITVLVFGCWRRRKQTRELINQVRNVGPTSATNTSTRPNAGNTTQTAAPGGGADAPARPPRRRRRRRPSQISTKSLPAYNEQAGDEEIVLVRRSERRSMSDDEYDDSNENAGRSENVTTTTADARPLLDDSSPDMPRVSLASSTRDRRSTPDDSLDDHERPQSQLENHEPNATTVTTPAPDHEPAEETHQDTSTSVPPIIEAPSYSEAIAPAHSQPASTPGAPVSGHALAAEATDVTTSSDTRPSIDDINPPAGEGADDTVRPKRKSVFRQLFALNRPGSSSAAPSESVELDVPGRPSISATSTRSATNHRSSGSVSTLAAASGRGHAISPSLSSLMLTRSRSPTRSTDSLAQRLNISAPIPSTLVRTELSYPRAGPTPEQIRFLSSRESLGRFGMPYGEQAIAAARSRDNISSILPPQYETPSAEGTNPDAPVNSATETQNTDANSSRQVTRGPIIYTPGELARMRAETSDAAPAEQATTDRHGQDGDSASPQSADLHRSPSPSTAPKDSRRASVYTTNSFVTATEGTDTATEGGYHSGTDSSPPTPTAETYREAGIERAPTPQQGQTVLVPEPDDAQHPQLTLAPATPTAESTVRPDNTA